MLSRKAPGFLRLIGLRRCPASGGMVLYRVCGKPMQECRYLINGKVSAEHDADLQAALARIHDTPIRLKCLGAPGGVKSPLDPAGILNPGVLVG